MAKAALVEMLRDAVDELRRHEPPRQEIVFMHDQVAALMGESEWERLAGAFGGRIHSRY